MGLKELSTQSPLLKSPHKYPPPPPLPHYDPNEEAPKCDWYRLWYMLPRYEKHPDQPERVGTHAPSDDKPDWRGVIKNNVVPLPKVEPYKFGYREDVRYFYFDTPDYADPFKKLWYSARFFTFTGIGIACFWGLMTNKGSEYKTLRYVFSRYTVPWFGGGMAASATAIAVANLRGNKDDLYNYVAGGLAASAVTGRANYLVHFRHTILWVTGAMYAKYNAEINGNMTLRMSPYAIRHGTSGMSAEGGFWTGNLNWFSYYKQGDPGRDVRGIRY